MFMSSSKVSFKMLKIALGLQEFTVCVSTPRKTVKKHGTSALLDLHHCSMSKETMRSPFRCFTMRPSFQLAWPIRPTNYTCSTRSSCLSAQWCTFLCCWSGSIWMHLCLILSQCAPVHGVDSIFGQLWCARLVHICMSLDDDLVIEISTGRANNCPRTCF